MLHRTSLLSISLFALLVAPLGCAAGGEEHGAEENHAASEQAFSLPKPPALPTFQPPDMTPITDALARSIALGQNGVAGADGFTKLVLAPLGEKPVVFRAANDAVTAIANGFAVNGALVLETPAGPLSFGSAEAVFEWGPDHSIGLATVHGAVDLPFPAAGALSGVEVSSLARGQIGYDLGANITGIEAPIALDRHFLYVDAEAGFSATSGIVTVSAPGGKALRALLDPTDPSLYFKGNVLGMNKFGNVEDLAVGISARGQIPFTPKVTWGIENEVKAQKGHLFVAGSIPLSRYPLTIDGEIVVNVDPDGTGKPAFSNAPTGIALAANGTVNVKLDYIPSVELAFPVVNATLGGKVTESEQYAYFSGEGNSDIKWIPSVIPLRPAGSLKVAGRVGSDMSKSFLKAEGTYTLATTMMNDWIGLGLKDIDFAKATMSVDQTGFRLTGEASTPIHAALAPQGQLAVDAFFSGQSSNWYAQASGSFSVAGFPLLSATARASQDGLSVKGWYQTPLAQIYMNGAITSAGPSLQGTAKVKIPIVGPKVVAVMMQHAQCGTDMVEDAAACGKSYGENAVACGTSTIKNGAKCGWDFLSGLGACFKGSCKVAKSCDVANECWYANTCRVQRTCPVDTTVPAFEFGTFEGTATISVGANGASAALAGSYCPKSGACMSLPSTKVVLGASPKACVSGIPGANGEFCAPF